tara:strand:- start:85 stop:423 length:339 start_codon:yes stop_codon:yes gene_type:complete
MTLIRLSKKGRAIGLNTRSHLSVTNDNQEIDTKEALVYLGDKRFTLTFVPTDKDKIRKCKSTHLEWLRREYQCKGDAEEIIKKMFPPSTVKKKMKAVVKPKSVIETKTETTG